MRDDWEMVEDLVEQETARADFWLRVAYWLAGVLCGLLIALGLIAGHWWANR